jgi:hypothetical protein
MRFRFKASTTAVLWLGLGLPTAFSQQRLQQPQPASFQTAQNDDHLAEVTPTSLSLQSRSGRRLTLKAQQHYQAARAAALDHHPEVYASETAKTLSLSPEAAEVFLLRATQEVAAARYSSALCDVSRARALNPRIAYGQTVLASVFNGMRDYEDAFLALRDLQGPEAESWQTIYERSRAELGMGDLHGADQWSRRLLAAAPRDFADAHLVRSQALAIASRSDESHAELILYQHSLTGQGQLGTGLSGSSPRELLKGAGGGN